MDWYKHDSSATQDAKIRKLLMFSERVAGSGVYGYAIYFHCLELITGDLSANNITFQLEHDSEIIADTLRIRGTGDKSGREIVEEIMRYMIDLHLFEHGNGRIICTKLLKRLDASMTSNPRMRDFITKAKQHHDGVMTGSCKNRIEENRIEEKREEDTKERHPKTGAPMNRTTYDSLVTDYGKVLVDDYFERIADYCETKKGRLTYYKDHAHACRNWLKRDKVAKLSKPAEKSEFEEGLSAMIRERYYDKPKA